MPHDWGDLGLTGLGDGLLGAALLEFQRFLLVVLRLSGLMIVGPLFGQPSVPMNVRALLVVALALILTPALSGHAARGFQRLDVNGDGRLVAAERPPGTVQPVQHAAVERSGDHGVTQAEYLAEAPARLPDHLGEWALVAVGELALGLVLGLGTYIVLTGLQLAGQMIDQQAGFSLGSVFNPDFDASGSVSGQTLFLLGLVIFLLMEPLGGHLVLLQTLVQTYETLPCGTAFVSLSAIELVSGLVQQSLLLGLKLAAPLVVMMTLVDLTLGFLAHSVPQVNLQVIGFATRASVCLLILGISLGGLGEVLVNALQPAMESLRDVLVHPTDAAGLPRVL
jgi:flagellar biosynthetic protein FliR